MNFDVERLLRSRNLSIGTDFSPVTGQISEEHIELWRDPSGPLCIWKVKSSNAFHYRLRLDETLAVDVLPNRKLLVRVDPRIPKSTIDHFLADQVMPRVVAHDGEFVVHSAAVRLGGAAILLVGASGSGKSTLATSFHRKGFQLMGDDAMIISADELPSAQAIYASLRLFPDSIFALLPDDVITEDIAHYSDKQRLSVPVDEGDGGPVPIAAIFMLDLGASDSVCVTRLAVAEACMAVIRNSFALDPTDARRAYQRLGAASYLTNRIPAYSISYPRDFDRLREVRSAIVTYLGALAAKDVG